MRCREVRLSSIPESSASARDFEVVDADERAAEGCELVLVLGGDGTFLRAAELARNVEIPVLGVNLGRIGFLAEAEADNIEAVLESAARGTVVEL